MRLHINPDFASQTNCGAAPGATSYMSQTSSMGGWHGGVPQDKDGVLKPYFRPTLRNTTVLAMNWLLLYGRV
ncbi:hypothetical protein RRG08_044157 [Elysia crispata]|uniref:Uncharacterized protein n=1 Tax=Elysia crispata TaxID=231223 RepID=A0AAE1BDC4_9GAST|nr:hypothetical protein RRG08_044157 [Elysia crispata]